MFCCTLLYVHSSIAIILMGKRELIALLNLSSWCLVMVERLLLAVPQGCLQFVIVVFPDHTHLLLRDMNIPQDVIGNRERWDWMHHAPETPETDYITPKQKRTIRKTASRIPVSVRPAKSLSVRKHIKDHFSSPALLSASKKTYKRRIVFFLG